MEHKAAEQLEKAGDKLKESSKVVSNKVQEGVDKGVDAMKKKSSQ